MIVLRALGTAEIDTGVATLTPSQEIAFAAALYLILEGGKNVSRKRLASLLWPRVPEKARMHRLRQTILQLKKVGFIVTADRNNLGCSLTDPSTDITELAGTDADALASHASLEFLPGYSPAFSDAFRDWVDGQREEAHAQITSRLLTGLNSARTRGDWSACDRFARQCRKLDPFNESAVLAQAEASAMRGAKKQAIEILDRYLVDVGSENPNLQVSASVLRRRITDRIPERTAITVRECAFVGRDLEMETLTIQLLAARRGVGGASLVRGEAGIGKSRLASELIKFAALEGIQTSRTTCRRSDVDRPLSVFVDLVPQLSELRGALGCSQESMSVLRELTEFDGRASLTSFSVDDFKSAHAKIRAALFDLFDAIAEERTVLLVIDDVQWLDASSVRLLTELLPWARSRKVLFVLTERSGTTGLTNNFSPDDLRLLTLGPLATQFGEAIVEEILKESRRPTTADLIQRLLSVGEGNPFFLQELGNHWLETGKDRGSPPSVAAIIDERLARLSTEALVVLQACAVLDVNATIERVERVLEYQSHTLLTAVQELSVAGMLQPEVQVASVSDEPLAVAHDLILTAALKRLARAPLAYMHRRAGTVLERETQGDGSRTSVLWACAFHWQNAGDRKRAQRAACFYAEHLLEVGLPRDASKAFERAFDFCVEDEQRLRVLSRLAISLQMCGRWDDSRTVLDKSRQLQAKTEPNANMHDDVELALFEARWRASLKHPSLVEDLKACTRAKDASPSHRVLCGLMGIKVVSEMNDLSAARELYLTTKPLFDDPSIPLTSRLEIEMVYHSICGDLGEAEQAADRLRIVAGDERDPRIAVRAFTNIGVAYRLAGRMDDAETILRDTLDLSLLHGYQTRASFALLNLVRVYLAARDIPRARAAMERFEALTADDQDPFRTAERLCFSVRLAVEEGRTDQATERYAELTRYQGQAQVGNWRPTVLALGIRIAIQQNVAAETIRALVSDLQGAHLESRGRGMQDFEAHALVLGLRYCGELEEGLRLLVEYSACRREKWGLPQDLIDLQRELRGSCTESNRERMEVLSAPI